MHNYCLDIALLSKEVVVADVGEGNIAVSPEHDVKGFWIAENIRGVRGSLWGSLEIAGLRRYRIPLKQWRLLTLSSWLRRVIQPGRTGRKLEYNITSSFCLSKEVDALIRWSSFKETEAVSKPWRTKNSKPRRDRENVRWRRSSLRKTFAGREKT